MMKINIKKTVLSISVFMVLLYPFNSTIKDLIYPNNIVLILTVLIGLFGICGFRFTVHIKSYSFICLMISIIIAFITLSNNYYLKNGQELKVILYIIYLLIPFIVSQNIEFIEAFCKVIKLFFIEHMIATYIGVLFKRFYRYNILAIIIRINPNCAARGNFLRGYIPGLTTHFSTNAIYLSISSLFLFSEYLTNRKKSTFIFFSLSTIALLVVGKRAHLIFMIVCCFILYIIDRGAGKDFLKKIGKTVMIISAFILVLVILSNYIPEVLNIFIRFRERIGYNDILNGRGELYLLALSLWRNNFILGNGWGAFSYHYDRVFHDNSYLDAHNVYLQLLCETGVIGFVFFTSLMFFLLFKSIKVMRNNIGTRTYSYNLMIKFSCAYQIFFLMYSFTGNPLYDPQCYVIYFMIAGFVVAISKLEEKSGKEKHSYKEIL